MWDDPRRVRAGSGIDRRTEVRNGRPSCDVSGTGSLDERLTALEVKVAKIEGRFDAMSKVIGRVKAL